MCVFLFLFHLVSVSLFYMSIPLVHFSSSLRSSFRYQYETMAISAIFSIAPHILSCLPLCFHAVFYILFIFCYSPRIQARTNYSSILQAITQASITSTLPIHTVNAGNMTPVLTQAHWPTAWSSSQSTNSHSKTSLQCPLPAFCLPQLTGRHLGLVPLATTQPCPNLSRA